MTYTSPPPSAQTFGASRTARIVIVGGGYVGMYAALHLRRKLRKDEAEIYVIDPKSYMTYQPFLPEAAAGNLAERHVVAPLRQVLRGVHILNGHVTRISHDGRYIDFRPPAGESQRIRYDVIVVAPGSISRTLPIDGLADRGIGFKTVGEAIYLRNHVLTQLDIAASTQDLKARRTALTFVFVGAGFAGVEFLSKPRTGSCLRSAPRWVGAPWTSCNRATSMCGCVPGWCRQWTAGSCSMTARGSRRILWCGRQG